MAIARGYDGDDKSPTLAERSLTLVDKPLTLDDIPTEVQAAYGLLAPDAGGLMVPLHSLINRTYLVRGDVGQGLQPMVLQRLHPVFGARVHEDIEAVTL